jgi:DNA-binding NarL/FixJ family response regulator
VSGTDRPLRERERFRNDGGTPPTEPTVVIGADEDHRRLVRGLLLMNHRPIALEAPSLGAVPGLLAGANARILVFDVLRENDRWSDELKATLQARPELSALVLLPLDEPSDRSSAARAGARAVLTRPFTSREFLEAVDRLVPERLAPRPAAPVPGSSTSGKPPRD